MRTLMKGTYKLIRWELETSGPDSFIWREYKCLDYKVQFRGSKIYRKYKAKTHLHGILQSFM